MAPTLSNFNFEKTDPEAARTYQIYTSKASADAMLPNPDGTNGAFKNATVVKE